jgi:diadenosine tetraphosphate (Ap4A) HIT family hydrolase
MSTTEFELHPQLAADTFELGDLALSRVLLMNDARFPWLILVPRRSGASDLIDLDSSDLNALTGEIRTVCEALRRVFVPDKLNVAALGNVVSQLHVHVMARFHSDAAWPRPVFGVGTPEPYPAELRLARIARLRAELALR